MNRDYWENIAPSYDDEIFDLLKNDKKALVRSAIEEYSSPRKTVIDIGCAIGKWLPILAPAFKKVVAVDISAKNLVIAKETHPQFNNIEYLRADMSGSNPRLPKCDAGICINAILTDSLTKRDAFFKNISSCIKKGGHLILTVPSLESWMLSHIIQIQWKIDKGHIPSPKGKEALTKYKKLLGGNADIDGVPTKHYLKEELDLLLSRSKFSVQKIEKINYEWNTEFIDVPRWLKEPYPWDWMVVAVKK
jgi:2-polyprenyl-3-methyl-5-hydroxy-6-metoxy-1,4-benzoquinol methylase